MRDFLVRWEINIEADSPREAAENALEIQRDPSSIATVFSVWGLPKDSTPWTEVDLG
jgi:hypothetical protein